MIWHASIRVARRPGVVRVCMVSTFSAEYGSTGGKSCSSTAEQGKIHSSLSPFAHENLV